MLVSEKSEVELAMVKRSIIDRLAMCNHYYILWDKAIRGDEYEINSPMWYHAYERLNFYGGAIRELEILERLLNIKEKGIY